MKCVYCNADLEGLDFTLVSAHKRKCSNMRRIYKPMAEPLKRELIFQTESKIAGFIISSNLPEMTGNDSYEIITPVPIDPIDKLICLTDNILEQIDGLEKALDGGD